MAAVINTNYLSLVAQNNLNKSQSSLGTAIERLSSGLRINSAKDDAAGMAIANRFTANVKGLTQAARNANDGISLAQTTEGAASEINTHLQRVRELSVQASNGSYSQEQLNSMQDEINQRLSDIDRISEQTDFNGVKVLSDSAKPLTLQVGANDGETITINLSEISVKTLGLDGFNVNGSGVTQNRTATVTDVLAQTGAAPAGANYKVTTTFAKADAESVLGKLESGNTVDIGTTKYTYDAKSDAFTYTKNVANADLTDITSKIKPANGKVTGTYEVTAGNKATIEVDASGKVTLDGQAAFITTEGELTSNQKAAGTVAATIDNVLTIGVANAGKGGTLTIGETTYKAGTAAGDISFNATATKADVLTAMSGAAGASTITMGSGITKATVTIGASSTESTNTYVDTKGELTQIAGGTYDTTYSINKDTGAVNVVSTTATDPKYAATVGAQAYVGSDGTLTTEKTSAGSKTVDPMKTLDAAFTKLDKLTGELGAVQNRLESTISNLNNVVNNLSSARSRIQDADYATEVSNMSKAQILQQAGTSVLAQANQVPQTVLSLLR
ncbi:MAG: flagellin [Achromobacter sp.]|uniref:flagellin N-terminal helical domain-containing protein n=1 Tax=Achromobacter sp. TaxID=134375 RepID=UPI0029A781DB|nr:flagellin [Achromobacter sp.]MDX3986654.1 flagellin [Achromobacter sp.]